jgi:tetratricopeptide (TPR) repeat protein
VFVKHWNLSFGFAVILSCCLCFEGGDLRGADLHEARQLFLSGKYEECIRVSERMAVENPREEEWFLILAEAQLRTGSYSEAHATIMNGLRRHRTSIRLRLLGRETALFTGDLLAAGTYLNEINFYGGSRMWAYRDPPNLVALGQAALLLGGDPKLVLDNFLERAKKMDPNFRGSYLAIGGLALEKHDAALAAKAFEEGLKRFPEDSEMNFGMARALSTGNRTAMKPFLEATLRLNPRHAGALLLMADHLVDAEEYEGEGKLLDKVIEVNRWHPEAWGYRAVLEHLQANEEGERKARETGLRHWKNNPQVDHLIGKKLSQKYRFQEGSARQRQALRFDSGYLPAKIQLAQDLLRLGEEEEGWRMAHAVHEADPYDVMAFNLVTLHDSLGKFETLTNEHFAVRMSRSEAAIYGERALELLERAREVLTEKYGLELTRRTIVEIFPDQKDFGVRTFGMPDNPGFLGVCFGCVITANSPASQGANPANWEAVLWHEFAHVVTLTLTENKMPRWLSEGISVYEERQENPVWGQWMTPRYREHILGGGLTPVGDLSGAFLKAQSGFDLQFAYFQSSLVVEFLVDRFGLGAIRNILEELRTGVPINTALERHTAPLLEIEAEFERYATREAEKLAPELEWEKPEMSLVTAMAAKDLPRDSRNFYMLTLVAKALIAEKKWEEAKGPLQRLLESIPNYTGPDNPYVLLGLVHRELEETDQEKEVLREYARRSADALDSFLRLKELLHENGDWEGVVETAERILAVNPLLPQPYRSWARASEELGKSAEAIRAYRKMLLFDLADPADANFRLAQLLHADGESGAKRHLLMALEEAPRFREAHRLLLEMNAPKGEEEVLPEKLAGEDFE